ncbi:MAG: peptide chain release factor N(5)-glutamine methyltransferase [Propionibacteriaceae bacterium]|nr:peptide chain release factor N(5)-glutamine methyltransferase [Propionibacteriaceae bacterium]
MSRPRPVSADERLLLAHVLGVPLTRLALVDELTAGQERRYAELLRRRAEGIPVQHLTGEAHFRTVTLKVGPGVFIPRPETESLVGWALQELAGMQNARVVELCAGSGAISKALATEREGLDLYAVELSEEALAYATENLAGLGVELRQGDMAEAFGDLDGTVDLVIANPPYIPLDCWETVPAEVRDHDPELALFSGADGLDALRTVAAVAWRLLRPGGLVGAEHAEVQSDAVVELFAATGFAGVSDHLDLTGRPRFVTGRRPAHGRMAS